MKVLATLTGSHATPPAFGGAVVVNTPLILNGCAARPVEYLNQNLGEFEIDVFAGQLLVNGAERVDFVLNLERS